MMRFFKNIMGVMLIAALVGSIAPVQAAQTGVIKGVVKYTGPKPRNPLIRMSQDPKCIELNKGKRVRQEYVVVGEDGGLKNVFVHLKEGVKGKFSPPKKPVILDQKNCLYHPRVQGMMVGQELVAVNSDPTLHNVHSFSKKGNDFNVAQPVQGMKNTFKIKSEEVMLQIKCDVHAWMRGYVGVVPHPFFSVTGGNGTFEIKNVPPGKYVIQVWHEKFGAQTKPVEVKPGGVVEVAFEYNGTEKAELNPGFVLQEVDVSTFSSPTVLMYKK